MTSRILGIHHVTAITADAQRNIDFYCGVLGLRLVKLTVNFDDPSSYHLYYGDELGRPGTILTFFAWPGADRGRLGPPQLTAISLSVPAKSMDFWRTRLAENGVAIDGPLTRFDDPVVAFTDPDGLRLEVVAPAKPDARLPWRASPVPAEHAIRGVYGVELAEEGYERTAALLTNTMGLQRVADAGNRFRFAATDIIAGSIVDVLCVPSSPRGALGAGIVHHVAFRAPDDASQSQWHRQLVQERLNVTPIIDRNYFHSIYFREPGGVLFEIATDAPGFTVDEAPNSLGTTLKLPAQFERARAALEAALPRLRLPKRAQR